MKRYKEVFIFTMCGVYICMHVHTLRGIKNKTECMHFFTYARTHMHTAPVIKA